MRCTASSFVCNLLICSLCIPSSARQDVFCNSANAERSERIHFADVNDKGGAWFSRNIDVAVPAEMVAGTESEIVVKCASRTKEQVEVYVWAHGPAMRYASNVMVGQCDFRVPLLLFDHGVYEVYVEILAHTKERKYLFWLPVLGSPFSMHVKARPDVFDESSTLREQIDIHTYSCGAAQLAVPSRECTGLSNKPGRWLRCAHMESRFPDSACTTQGWTFVPEDCYYSKLGPDVLKAKNETSWIVFVGTSVLRGAFWAAVDAALHGTGGNFTRSSTWKCWGWIDYRIGNLRISYRDFRRAYMGSDPSADNAEYISNTTINFQELGAEQYGGKRGPDVVVHEFWPGNDNAPDPTLPTHIVQDTLEWLGTGWDGQLWIGHRLFFPFQSSDINRRYNAMLQTVATSVSETDTRVHFYDVLDMSGAFLHHMQLDIKDGITQHHHKQCSGGETIGGRGAHVCGPAAEMSSTLFLHALLAANRFPSVGDPQPAPMASVDVCESCPLSLTPFSSPHVQAATCVSF